MSSKKRKSRSSKQQTQLTFEPLEELTSSTTMSPAKVRYETRRTTRSTPASSNQNANDHHGTTSNTSITPAQTKKNLKLPFTALPTPQKSSQILADKDDDELEHKSSPALRQPPARFMSTTKGKKSQRRIAVVADETSDESNAEGPSAMSRKKSSIKKGKKVAQNLIELSDTDESVSVAQAGKGRLRASRVRTPDVQKDSDDEPIITSSVRKKRVQSKAPEVEDDDDDEDEEPVTSPLKRRRPVLDPGSSSDVGASPPKRTRLVGRQQQNSDSDDLPDLDQISKQKSRRDSESSSTPGPTVRKKAARKKRLDPKAKALDLLRRKRNGENTSDLAESESEPDLSKSSEDDGLEVLDVFDDEEEEEELPAPKSSKKILNYIKKPQQEKESGEEEGSQLSDFIDDQDEDLEIGIPAIPLEFTRNANKRPKEHFKDVVEWMVHNKINPGFPRNDPVYDKAFTKLNDECLGLATSKFASTQWTKEFYKAVFARPLMEVDNLHEGEGFDMASGLTKCDACNHRKHKPSRVLVFNGKAYNKRTLEELEPDSSSSNASKESKDSSDNSDNNDSDDSEASNDDHASINSRGQEIPPATVRYAVGSVCMMNAQQTHTLVHWKYTLNDWVISTLDGEGELIIEKLALREKMNLKKRTRYANKVVDRWEESGRIKELWHDYKIQLETAREMTAKAKGGWR